MNKACEKALARHGVAVSIDKLGWSICPEYIKAYYSLDIGFPGRPPRHSLTDSVQALWDRRGQIDFGFEVDLAELWDLVLRELHTVHDGGATYMLGPLARLLDGDPYAFGHLSREWCEYYFL